MDWFKNGFETAKGSIRTGWMCFGKSESEEALNIVGDLNSQDLVDKLRTWIEEWMQTEQWICQLPKAKALGL